MLYVLTGNNDFNYMKIFLQNNCYFFFYSFLAVSLVVCIEVLMKIFRYTHKNFPDIYPENAELSHGPCYVIAWIIFVQLLGSSMVFFACSKKRKGTFDEATEEEALANRPVDLSRSFRS
jgi:hypothetical protein